MAGIYQEGGEGAWFSDSINRAAGLAQKEYRVLMVDSDPQTNPTMCFLPDRGRISFLHPDVRNLSEVLYLYKKLQERKETDNNSYFYSCDFLEK